MSLRRSDPVAARALTSPAWLACLVLLLVNDHWLKGSGLLPGVVTGKLSDFAGLFVAPLLLALVLRVSTRRGWWFAHLAVGLGFSAIQLSPLAAEAWAAAMGASGFAWVITPDPTDLLALPALAASYLHLPTRMRVPARAQLGQGAHWGAAAVGLWACAATSSPETEGPPGPGGETGFEDPEPDPEWDEPPATLPDLYTDVHLHNGTLDELVVRIRPLDAPTDLDCDTIAQAPGELLTSPLFGLAETWTLPAGTNQPILSARDDARDCHAALVELDAMPPRLLFWYATDYPMHTVPGLGDAFEDPGQLAVFADPEGGPQWAPGAAFAHEPAPRPAACAPQPDATRLAYAEPLPLGRWTIDVLEAGVDGCVSMTLSDDGGRARTWFLCIPADAMPLVAGDVVDVQIPAWSAAIDGDFGGVTLETVEADGIAPRRLSVVAGSGLPAIDGLELAAIPDFECDAEIADDCGTVARPVHLSVAGTIGAATLNPDGTVVRLGDDTRTVDLALLHGQERFALQPACSLGPDLLGYDLELVFAERPL